MDEAARAPRTRVAAVTGAARGLGLACSLRLAADGFRVAVLDGDGDAAQRAVARLAGGAQRHWAAQLDVTAPAQVAAVLEEAAQRLGLVDTLVNNAGVLTSTRFLDIDEDEWDRVLAVTVTGTFLCSRACLPAMIERRFGRIVNFSSTAGKSVSTIGGAHYTTAKAAVLGLTRAVATEMAPHGITVNAVCPGLFDTEMVRSTIDDATRRRYASSFPIERLGRPDEVGELVAFLCSERAGYITGAALDINGGDLMV
jgi:3-oxoacyl-[acyl-carrier protein] reductase